jgi:hypothetical protein
MTKEEFLEDQELFNCFKQNMKLRQNDDWYSLQRELAGELCGSDSD